MTSFRPQSKVTPLFRSSKAYACSRLQLKRSLIVLGILLFSLGLIEFQSYWHRQLEQAKNTAALQARLEIAQAIENELGTYTGNQDFSVLFSVKELQVVVVEAETYKTLQVALPH